MVNRARAAAWAASRVGMPYVFDTAGPDSFDCSGLVVAAYHHEGLQDLPHSTALLWRVTEQLADLSSVEPGDLVFFYGDQAHQGEAPTHVAIFLSRAPRGAEHLGHWIVQATDEQHGVEIVRMREYAAPTSYGRVTSHR